MDVHEIQRLLFMYDCQNNLTPVQFHSYFILCPEVHNYNTWQVARSHFILTRKTTFQYRIRSIQYSDERLWNSIPTSIRD